MIFYTQFRGWEHHEFAAHCFITASEPTPSHGPQKLTQPNILFGFPLRSIQKDTFEIILTHILFGQIACGQILYEYIYIILII